jgi:hypothetical protein
MWTGARFRRDVEVVSLGDAVAASEREVARSSPALGDPEIDTPTIHAGVGPR